MSRTKRVWIVLADGRGSGPAGDGTYVNRFGSQKAADAFASRATYYGQAIGLPIEPEDVPLHIAQRWGF